MLVLLSWQSHVAPPQHCKVLAHSEEDPAETYSRGGWGEGSHGAGPAEALAGEAEVWETPVS